MSEARAGVAPFLPPRPRLRVLAEFLRLPLSQPIAEAAGFLVLWPMLLLAALWNGFPLIFYDTGAYIFEGFGERFVAERSPVYSLYIVLAGGGWSLWLVALAQAAMTAFVMLETARCVAPRLPLGWLAAIAGGLVLLTGLPWYAAQIEPDCFTPLVVLSLYLLAFHGERLGTWRAGLVLAIAALSIGAHPSHLGLAAGLVFVLAAYRLATKFSARFAWPRATLLAPALATLLGFALVFAGNYHFTRSVFISRAGSVFVFARMLQDGLVKQVLNDTCPQSHYALCAYRNALPDRADKWLWGPRTPFVALHRFNGTEEESQRIVLESLARYPLLNIGLALRDSAEQFVTFRTGDQIEPQQWILYPDFHNYIPGQLKAYATARQQKGQIDFRPINAVHVPIGWLALAFLMAMLGLAVQQRDAKSTVLLGFVLAALLGNAVICGVLSNPHARYQSRLIWVPAFALVLLGSEKRLTKSPRSA